MIGSSGKDTPSSTWDARLRHIDTTVNTRCRVYELDAAPPKDSFCEDDCRRGAEAAGSNLERSHPGESLFRDQSPGEVLFSLGNVTVCRDVLMWRQGGGGTAKEGATAGERDVMEGGYYLPFMVTRS